jgi:hypothetical protein
LPRSTYCALTECIDIDAKILETNNIVRCIAVNSSKTFNTYYYYYYYFFIHPWYLVPKGLEIIKNVTKSLGVSRPVVRKIVFLLERVREADCVESLQGDRYTLIEEACFSRIISDSRKAIT